MTRSVALIGFGALGHAIASELQSGHIPGVAFLGALVPPGSGATCPDAAWHRVEDLLASGPDLVVEAAGQAHWDRMRRPAFGRATISSPLRWAR
jgi:aspartate dehydrogenase